MKEGILFLTLNTFSVTGGIEKVCRIAAKAFSAIATLHEESFRVYSMHDRGIEDTAPYISKALFRAASGKKFSFVRKAIQKGCRSRVVVISHIHLALPAVLIKIFSPRTRLIVMAHGIEVWKPLSQIQKRCLQQADRVVCVSRYTRDHLKEMIPPGRSLVLNNCLDPYLPLPDSNTMDQLKQQWHIGAKEKVIMTLSRISAKEKKKNFDTVFEALSLLPAGMGKWKYLLVGKYTKDERQRLEQVAKKLGIEENVQFTGYVADDDLGAVYALADVYVMPSEKEGFGMSFIEAMHYGVPVIGGNTDGSKDALLDGRLGWLIPTGDVSAIAAALGSVLADPVSHIPDKKLLMEHFEFEQYKNKWIEILSTSPSIHVEIA